MSRKINKIALIQGGMGAEAEVSRKTGKAFAAALEKLHLPFETLEANSELPKKLFEMKPDVALLAVHGKYAEDGTVQGLCEYLKIPYSGSGVFASALGMNKYFTKQVLIFNQIPTPAFEYVDVRKTKQLSSLRTQLSFPLVVKPSREGSTVGISMVNDERQFTQALQAASQFDYEILIEEFIAGTEITVPILDDRALTPIEIVPINGFYDYQHKYTAGKTEYILPPRLGKNVLENLRQLALKTHNVCQARVYSRVDFRVTESGSPFVLEINTLPGCTETSLLPKAAAYDGMEFTDVIRILVERAGLDYEGLR